MKQIPDESIDLIITSLPYNLRCSTGNSVKKSSGGRWKNATILTQGYSHHSDNMPHAEYVARHVTRINTQRCYFYNHKGRVQGGKWQDRADILAEFPLRQMIIWYRKSIESTDAQLILDPFVGLGTVPVACVKSGRQ